MATKFPIYQSGSSFYSNKKEAVALSNESSFGELKEGRVIYSIFEVLFLFEKNKAELLNNRSKKITFNQLLNKTKKQEHKSYLIFKDLRNKGFIVKEGLKFGTDFRIYEKGQKPGKNHAKYLLHVAESKEKLNLKDFAAKSRIANTTGKKLLLAIIDSEEDINYYEVSWKNIL